MIEELLAYNRKFVEEKRYEQYAASKYPNKKIAILTCMDTRLVELLPAALGLRNGDVKIIKNAGGVVTNPFGSVIRSLLVAIIELGVEEIMVIGHTDCGVQHIDSESMIAHMKQRGVSQASIDLMKYCGIDFERWLAGFDTVEQSVTDTVNTIRNHPLMPRDVRIGGYVIDTETGELSTVICCPWGCHEGASALPGLPGRALVLLCGRGMMCPGVVNAKAGQRQKEGGQGGEPCLRGGKGLDRRGQQGGKQGVDEETYGNGEQENGSSGPPRTVAELSANAVRRPETSQRHRRRGEGEGQWKGKQSP